MSIATKPALELAMTPYALADQTIQVPCELVDDNIAIVPAIVADEEGTCTFNGRFGLTHRPTGLRFTGTTGGCIACVRRAANQIKAMGIDWSEVTKENANSFRAGLPSDIQEQLQDVLYVGFTCDAYDCTDEEI